MNVSCDLVSQNESRSLQASVLPRVARFGLGLMVVLIASSAFGQSASETAGSPAGEPAAGENPAGEEYVSALKLLPQRTAGTIRIPDLPEFLKRWDQTNLGRLLNDPAMQPFLEAQRERVRTALQSPENQVGLRLDDLRAIATGEVVAAWLPFEADKRRPFAVCVIADIRGSGAKVGQVLAQVDEDLKAGGATRRDLTHRGQTVRVYTTQPKPGQLKIDQIAIAATPTRIIAADRDTVVMNLLDAIAGEPREQPLSASPEFQAVMTHSREAIAESVREDQSHVGLEWFARPFAMGRVLREIFEVDRGKQVDILQLLENQGFDAIEAVGGVAALAGQSYDWLHRGLVLAPPTTDAPSRYEKAARMLQLINQPLSPIPAWVPQDAASFLRLNWKMSEAFWASETLVNEAFGDEIFQPMIEGIREDEEGPQIDLKNEVLPALGEQLILLTDNTSPATTESERMLVAIRVNDAEAIARAVHKAMEVEPDASRMEVLPGVEIWRVQRGGRAPEDFNEELFGDFGFEQEVQVEEQPPLLDRWAIALVHQGPGSDAPYLMFSSHPELLVETARRIQQPVEESLRELPAVQRVYQAMQQLGADEVAMDRVIRAELAVRVKYQLLRQGELRESDSVLATLLRRVFQDQNGRQAEEIDGSQLPPLEQIEQYLQPGGNFLKTTDQGYTLNGFLLK